MKKPSKMKEVRVKSDPPVPKSAKELASAKFAVADTKLPPDKRRLTKRLRRKP